MTARHKRPSLERHLEPPRLPERLDENWRAIEGRLEPSSGRHRPWLYSGGLALAAAAAFLAVWFARTDGVPVWKGEHLVADGEPLEVRLPDGSEIRAHEGTELRSVVRSRQEAVLRLTRGMAEFEVEPDPARAFVVLAGDVEVRVVGTVFRVGDEAGGVRVVVSEGAVDVRRGSDVLRLRPGDDRLFEREDAPTPAADEANEIPPPEHDTPETEGSSPPPEQEAAPDVEDSDPVRTKRAARRARESARALLEEAQRLRGEGRPAEAAERYERLIRRHGADDRAHIAAMELARVQMDALGDPEGALRALRFALRREPHSPLRQEAMARMVRAYERLGLTPECERARRAYLDAFPAGSHVADVQQRCR